MQYQFPSNTVQISITAEYLTEYSAWNTDICGNSSVHKSLYKWCMCFQIYDQPFHFLQSVSDCSLCTCYPAYIEKQGMQCYFLPVF